MFHRDGGTVIRPMTLTLYPCLFRMLQARMDTSETMTGSRSTHTHRSLCMYGLLSDRMSQRRQISYRSARTTTHNVVIDATQVVRLGLRT